MTKTAILKAAWREPAAVLSAFADEPWAIGFSSGDREAEWSYVARAPDAVLSVGGDDPRDPFRALAELTGPYREPSPGGPPFQGGVAGLAAYELGERIERLGLPRLAPWPDLACARYPAVIAFDHRAREIVAVGQDESQARAALSWLELEPRPAGAGAATFASDDAGAYETKVDEVVARIAAGEIFQANIARRWRGRLAADARPFDLFARLAQASPSPFASYLRLPGQAVVSNSPERFLRVVARGGKLTVETKPIKGTAPRGGDPVEDAAFAEALAASAKDRAENLMIVDLMRNDLARVCRPGSVTSRQLFQVQSFANVHHLVSTVTGRLADGRSAVDLLRAAFPPGSITGAPKVQAMKVIAELEAPRGPFFGSMFLLGFDGSLESNVLIRTAAFVEDAEGWRAEARAGAGIVADSLAVSERRETDTKIASLARALAAFPTA